MEQNRVALRVINLDHEAKSPTGFDMESAIKAKGGWECGDYHCNGCPYVRNLRCMERYGLLSGDPPWNPAKYRPLLHATPGEGMKKDPQPLFVTDTGVTIWEQVKEHTPKGKKKGRKR